jgi:hypothetical protein
VTARNTKAEVKASRLMDLVPDREETLRQFGQGPINVP